MTDLAACQHEPWSHLAEESNLGICQYHHCGTPCHVLPWMKILLTGKSTQRAIMTVLKSFPVPNGMSPRPLSHGYAIQLDCEYPRSQQSIQVACYDSSKFEPNSSCVASDFLLQSVASCQRTVDTAMESTYFFWFALGWICSLLAWPPISSGRW